MSLSLFSPLEAKYEDFKTQRHSLSLPFFIFAKSGSGLQCGRMTRSQGRVVGNNRQEQVNCPRCESVNTKFCYYNNYSQSQPRYFCKNCRRYWTQGGALRSVPVGGGCRKNKPTTKPAAKPADFNTSSSFIPELPAITRTQLPYNYNCNYPSDNTDIGFSTVQESLIRAGSEILPRGNAPLGSNNLSSDAPTSCRIGSLPPPLGMNAPPMGNNNLPMSWLLSSPRGYASLPFGSSILHADTPAPCLSIPGGLETGLPRQPQSVMQQLQLIQEAVSTGSCRFLPELIQKGNQGGGEKGFLMESLATDNSGQLKRNMNNASWPLSEEKMFPLLVPPEDY